MRRLYAITIALLAAAGCATGTSRMTAAAHGPIFLTGEERAAVRARAESLPWARENAARVVEKANALLGEPLDIPAAGGQWEHYYLCFADGAALEPESPVRHVCPVCLAVYSGPPYDEAYVTVRHKHWIEGLEALGQAYVLTGSPEYAARAHAILMAYAHFYGLLPWQNKTGALTGSKARLFTQTLDEAEALCRMLYGYDLVCGAPCFSEADRAHIERDLIRAMVRTIRRNDKGLSNWQAWHNAAVGCAGFFLNDHRLVRWALDHRNGFRAHMRQAVTGSGLWHEGSPIYHYYALRAYVYLMEAAARSGIDLYGEAHAERLFRAPLRQLLPDATFVPFNDSDRVPIVEYAALYEVAYRRFGDPIFASYLDGRMTPWALFWGADDAPAAEPWVPTASSNGSSEGLAVLRSPAGIAAMLEYGAADAGHIHPARLRVVLYAAGDLRLVESGRARYADPLHRAWYRQTVAHNAVVVDERSQWLAPARLKAFGVVGEATVARAACDGAYPGVSIDRTLLLDGNVLVDVVHCRAKTPRTFDLPLHFQGRIEGLPSPQPLTRAAHSPGYREIAALGRVVPAPEAFGLECAGNSVLVQVFDRSEAFSGQGYGPARSGLLPMTLRRQQGTRCTFITVYQVLPRGETPRPVCVTGDDPAIINLPGVTLECGKQTAIVLTTPQGPRRHLVTEGGAGDGTRGCDGP